MKKLMGFLMTLAALMALVGCSGGAKPEDTVKDYFKAYQAGDFVKAASYTTEPDDGMNLDMDIFEGEMAQALLKAMTSVTYTVGETTTNGDNATVSTAINTVDLAGVFQDTISAYIQEAMTNMDITEEEIDTLLETVLQEQLADTSRDRLDFTVDIQLEKMDGDWKIDISDTMQNALSGGLMNLLNDFGQLFG